MATYTRSSQTTPEIREQDVRPLFKTFLGSLTVQQQALLKRGEPDSGTEILSAKLVQDIIVLVTKCISETDDVNAVTSEVVRSSLGDTLHRVLAVVLKVNVQVNCESTKILTDLIAEDVAERVNSSSDNKSGNSSDRLTEMVRHVYCSFKAFMAKIRAVLTPRRSGHQHQDRSVETKETFSRRSEDNSTTPSGIVQQLIGKELGELAGPFLDIMEVSERELLQSDTDRETESFAKDIAKSVDELVEKDAARTRPESEKRVQQLWKEVPAKIKIFLAKQFAKLLAHPVAKELKDRFLPSSTVESDESIQSFSKAIEDLILPEDDQQAGNEAVLERLQHIFSGKDLVFTEALCEYLYNHITKSCEINPEALTRVVHVLPSRENMYAYIHGKVQRFLRLMGWCLATQFGFHSEKFTQALMDALSLAREKHASIQKTAVLIVVEKLVTWAFSKTKVNFECGSQLTIIPLLVEEIWAEIKGLDVELTPEIVDDLDKAIYKTLLKNCGDADCVLAMMRMCEGYIGKIFKETLLTPPKTRSPIWSFFSRVGKAITKTFTAPVKPKRNSV